MCRRKTAALRTPSSTPWCTTVAECCTGARQATRPCCRATLQVLVSQKDDGAAVSGARVMARIEGAAEPSQYSTATGLDGKAQLAFDMPRLAGAECALVVEASNGKAQARLQFQLRAKPKVPAGG